MQGVPGQDHSGSFRYRDGSAHQDGGGSGGWRGSGRSWRGCGRSGGGSAANSGLFLDSFRAVNVRYGICKRPIAAARPLSRSTVSKLLML